MKIDGLGRCHLKGCEGDATNVTLSAVGHNKATYAQRQGSAGPLRPCKPKPRTKG